MFFTFLVSRSHQVVTSSSRRFMSHFRMHDLPHRGSLCSSWITSSIVRPVNSLHDCVRCHASRSSSALRGRGSLWWIKSLNLRVMHLVTSGCHPSWINFSSSEHLHLCWAAQEVHHSSRHLTFSTMSQSASVIAMSAHRSAVSSVTGLRDSMKGSTVS